MPIWRIVVETGCYTTHASHSHVGLQWMPGSARGRRLQSHPTDRVRQLYPMLYAAGEPKQGAQFRKFQRPLRELAPSAPCEQDFRKLALDVGRWQLQVGRLRIPFDSRRSWLRLGVG